jgi:GDSL-like Lipase/Acylhydrolase family
MLAAVLLGVSVPLSLMAAPAAAAGMSFTVLQAGFTQSLYGTGGGFFGGIAFAPNGDPLVDFCASNGSSLDRFDHSTTLPMTNGTATIHPFTTETSGAGCGLTNHPDGALYSNTSGGVVKLDAASGAVLAGPFGSGGNALGIAVDPITGNLAYVESDGTIGTVNAGLTTNGTFSTATRGDFIDQIAFDPSGNFLFLSDRAHDALAILKRDGTLVQTIPLAGGRREPDGIAFHVSAPQFVVTNDTDGTLSRFDFPGNNFTMTPTQSVLASGGFRGDNSAVGSDTCLYLTQDGTRFDDGTTSRNDSLVRLCPGFAPPPGVQPVAEPFHMVVMGDSYSSGEGTFNQNTNSVEYYADSATKSNTNDECHRSPGAYGPLLGVAEADPRTTVSDLVACSGATIDQIRGGRNGEPPQLGALNSTVTTVALTAGGDDLGFEQVLAECTDALSLAHPKGIFDCINAVQKALSGIPTTVHKLEKLLDQIEQLTTAPGASHGAAVFLLAYPRLFPTNGDETCDHITRDKQLLLNESVEVLDGAYHQMANKLPYVHFVDVRGVFDGHAICGNSGQPYINDLQLDAPFAHNCPTAYLAQSSSFLFVHAGVCSQSYHPNTAGWAAEAGLLRKELTQYAVTSTGSSCVSKTRPATATGPGFAGDYRLGDNGAQVAPTSGPSGGPGPFAPVGGVYADVLNCSPWVEPGSNVSAWVMLEQFGDANSHIQAGWLENSGGSRTTLVELQDGVTQARAAFGESQYTYDRCDIRASLYDLTCPSNSASPYPLPLPPPNFSTYYTIEFHPFAAPINRVFIVTEDLPFQASPPTDPRCIVSTGFPPRHHVECKEPFVENGTFYVFMAQPGSSARTQIASAPARYVPNQANIAGETHNGFDQMPGTVSRPEIFGSAHVFDRGGWVGFGGAADYNGVPLGGLNTFYGNSVSGSTDPLGPAGQQIETWDPRLP